MQSSKTLSDPLALAFRWISSSEDISNLKLACKLWKQVYETHIVRQLEAKCPLDDSQVTKLSKNHPNLTHLSLKQGSLTDRGLWEVASNCCELLSFKLFDAQRVQDRGIVLLANNCRSLKKLSLANCRGLTDATLEGLASSELQLEAVDFSGCDKVSLKSIIELLQSSRSIRLLNLSRCTGIDWEKEVIEKVPSCTDLRTLILSGSQDLNDEAFSLLCQRLFPLSTSVLQELDLTNCLLIDRGLLSLRGRANALQNLNLGGCNALSNTTFSQLAPFLPNLQSVSIGPNANITFANIKLLLKHCTKLEKLSLSKCTSIRGYDVISLFRMLPSLCRLEIDGAIITQTNLWERAFAGDFNILDLSYCEGVDDAALQTISVSLSKLNRINLAGCTKVTDKGISPLLAKTLNLTELDLSGTAVTETSFQGLSDQGQTLLKLNLAGCEQLTNDGLKNIGIYCPSLTTLTLDDCSQLTDEAFSHIGNNRLAQLSLKNCQLSPQAIQGVVFRSPHLTSLTLGPRITDQVFQGLTLCTQFIEQIIIIGNDTLTDKTLKGLASGRPPLTHLELIGCTQFTDEAFIPLIKGCPKLQRLVVEKSLGLTSKAISALASTNSNLAHLRISESPEIQGQIEPLIDLAYLKYLSIDQCGSVTQVSSLSKLPLHSLELSSATITYADLNLLCSTTPIKRLVLKDCQLAPGKKSLLSEVTKLETVELWRCKGDVDLAAFQPSSLTLVDCEFPVRTQLLKLLSPKLEELHLQSSDPENSFRDSDIALLAKAPNLDRLKLGRNPFLTPEALIIASQAAPLLTSLMFEGRQQFRTGHLEVSLPPTTQIKEVAFPQTGEKLSDRDLRNISSVFKTAESITLRNGLQITDTGLLEIAGLGKGIQRVILDNCPQVTSVGIGALMARCPLKELTLANLPQLDGLMLQQLNGKGEKLEKLFFLHCESLSPRPLAKMLGGLKHLKALTLSDCQGVTDTTLQAIGTLKQLEAVDLSRSSGYTDAKLALLDLPQLQRCDLSYNIHIGDPGVKQLLQNAPQLSVLKLNYCPRITEGITRNNLVELSLEGCLQVRQLELSAKRIRKLNLKDCQSLPAGLLIELLSSCKELRILNLSGNTQTTGTVLASLAQTSKLEELYLKKNLTSLIWFAQPGSRLSNLRVLSIGGVDFLEHLPSKTFQETLTEQLGWDLKYKDYATPYLMRFSSVVFLKSFEFPGVTWPSPWKNVTLLRDGKVAAVKCYNQKIMESKITLWESVDVSQPPKWYLDHKAPISDLLQVESQPLLIGCDSGETIKIWQIENRTCLHTLKVQEINVGREAHQDCPVDVWDTLTKKYLADHSLEHFARDGQISCEKGYVQIIPAIKQYEYPHIQLLRKEGWVENKILLEGHRSPNLIRVDNNLFLLFSTRGFTVWNFQIAPVTQLIENKQLGGSDLVMSAQRLPDGSVAMQYGQHGQESKGIQLWLIPNLKCE